MDWLSYVAQINWPAVLPAFIAVPAITVPGATIGAES